MSARLAFPAAALGGTLNALAFPGAGWWPLVFIGTPLILFALAGRRLSTALAVGAVAGSTFWGMLIFWLTVYLGPVPWLALSALEAVFFAVGCVVIALAWRVTDRAWHGAWGRLGLTPVIIAGLWVLREYVTSNWPYGGFSWGRLAFSQSESPFSQLAAWVGVSGLSFVIAWAGALVAQVARETTWRERLVKSAAPAGLIVVLMVIPAFPIATSGAMRIAAVQGNADAGLFAQNGPGQILQDHVAATQMIYGQPVDLVVWPENAADLNPLENKESAATLDGVTGALKAPLVTGAITSSGNETFNSLLLWKSGAGAVAQYDKIHPVPFGEYLPNRDFWYPLAPDLFSLVPRDYSFGTRANVFDIEGVAAGLAICFDIVDDNVVRQMITGGAQVVLAPSNNADFGRSDESVQQLAIARLRAIEAGRSLVNISTVGTSAMVAPDGSIIDQLPTFRPGAMVQEVPLSTTRTPAMVIGQALELIIAGLGLAGLVVAAIISRRSRLAARR